MVLASLVVQDLGVNFKLSNEMVMLHTITTRFKVGNNSAIGIE